MDAGVGVGGGGGFGAGFEAGSGSEVRFRTPAETLDGSHAVITSTTAPSSHPAPCLGRVPYLAELDGPGVPTLRSRIQAA